MTVRVLRVRVGEGGELEGVPHYRFIGCWRHLAGASLYVCSRSTRGREEGRFELRSLFSQRGSLSFHVRYSRVSWAWEFNSNS